MKVLLSSIGSRGDVQPILALALELRARGHEPRLCVAPNFGEWVESHGIACIPIGPDLKQMTRAPAGASPLQKSSPEQRRQLATHAIHSQFPVLAEAARDCDVIVAAGALQLATRSISETLGVPYVFVGYCPVIFPSADHPPPKFGVHHSLSLPAEQNLALWEAEEQHWNDLFGAALNEERAKLGLAPVENVLRHVLSERPWLAADPVLAPAPASVGLEIVQSGAWFLRDQGPLPDALQRFLESGAPPVYLGVGSMRAAESMARMMMEAARALGCRMILSKGWANLSPVDAGADCLGIGDVDHERLFPHVAAIVHHGGAGTTTAAARAGRSQIILPHVYDQFYFAHRVQQSRIGVAGPTREELTAEALTEALRKGLQPELRTNAQAVSSRIERNGTQLAADRLIDELA